MYCEFHISVPRRVSQNLNLRAAYHHSFFHLSFFHLSFFFFHLSFFFFLNKRYFRKRTFCPYQNILWCFFFNFDGLQKWTKILSKVDAKKWVEMLMGCCYYSWSVTLQHVFHFQRTWWYEENNGTLILVDYNISIINSTMIFDNKLVIIAYIMHVPISRNL